MEFLIILIIAIAFIYNASGSKPYKQSKQPSLKELHDLPKPEYDDYVSPYSIPYRKKAYLASIKWDTLRRQVLRRDSYTCQGCGTSGIPLEVHHITYVRFENEDISDLVSVCRCCHQAIHDKHGYDYTNTFPLERR